MRGRDARSVRARAKNRAEALHPNHRPRVCREQPPKEGMAFVPFSGLSREKSTQKSSDTNWRTSKGRSGILLTCAFFKKYARSNSPLPPESEQTENVYRPRLSKNVGLASGRWCLDQISRRSRWRRQSIESCWHASRKAGAPRVAARTPPISKADHGRLSMLIRSEPLRSDRPRASG